MLRPSSRDFTDWILTTARVSVTSNGSLPSRRIVSLMSLLTGPRIFSTASGRVRPITGSVSRWVMRSFGFSPAPAELAARLHLHVAEVLLIEIARMRVEVGQHAVDRRLDELLVRDLLDVIGTHALEHLA